MAFKNRVLLSGAEETGAGSAVDVAVPNTRQKVPYQIDGISTATVKIQGSLDGDNWFDLVTATDADEIGQVNAYPHMRGNVSSYTSGTINVTLFAAIPYYTNK